MTFAQAIHFWIAEFTRFISPLEVAAEWLLFGLGALAVAAAPRRPASWMERSRRLFLRIANQGRLAVVLSGMLPVAIRLALLPWMPVPDPSIHDEFSHLLLADTLAHGRLTNPTHPMWQHFETIHVIQKPTYASMYPPGQGAFLALGQVVFGDPWAGVVIGVGVMFAATCWMMQEFMPPGWAFYTTLVAGAKIGVTGLWMNSYLGGAVASTGGALLIGAVARLRKGPARLLYSLFLGAGCVILMNTRPFEGAVLAVAAAAVLAPAFWRCFRHSRIPFLKKAIAPGAAVLLAGFAFTGYYSYRVTGSALRMPYMVNRDTYGWPENLGFLPPKKTQLQHPELQAMYEQELRHRQIYTRWDYLVDNLVTRGYDNWTYFVGPILTLPLFFLPCILRKRSGRLLAGTVALMLLLNLGQMVLYPYHLGPIVPALFALAGLGMQVLYSYFGQGRRWVFVTSIVLLVAVTDILKQNAEELEIPVAYWDRAYEIHRDARAFNRQWLSARKGKQLVIVRYAPGHLPDQEWVYNGADIDGSKVVWAREMDARSNAELVRYFKDREPWLLNVDEYPARVVPWKQSQP